MRKTIILMLLCSFLVFEQSCLDPIDFRVDSGQIRGLVINGNLCAGPPHVLSIFTELIFNYEVSSRNRVVVREMILENDLGQTINVPQRGTGWYYLELHDDDVFQVEDGMSFKLYMEMLDGATIESEFEPLWQINESSTLTKERTEVQRLDARNSLISTPIFRISGDVELTSTEPELKARMKWDFHEMLRMVDDMGQICYIRNNQDVLAIKVFDSNLLSGGGAIPLIDRAIDNFMSEGYYMIAVREALSESAYEYWKNVETLVEGQGGQFEPVRGQLQSNYQVLSGAEDLEVFGFFYATSTDTTRIYVSPEEAGNLEPFCDIPVPEPPQFPCGDCLEHPRSTTQRPNWWIQQ